VPEPPGFLSGYARDEWWRVAPELHRLGLLTVLDFNIVAAYADAAGRWRQAVETLNGMAERDPAHGLLLKRVSDGNPMRNPLAALASDAANAMLKFASELGCTAIARARLASAGYTPDGPSKFDGLLAE
jgi:P27 family predicted phage terminase small subunit